MVYLWLSCVLFRVARSATYGWSPWSSVALISRQSGRSGQAGPTANAIPTGFTLLALDGLARVNRRVSLVT